MVDNKAQRYSIKELQERYKWFAPKSKANTNRKTASSRKYDVRVSFNGSGENRSCVRFGFLNNERDVFREFEYLTFIINSAQNRIYFYGAKNKDEQPDYCFYRLSRNGAKSGNPGRYIQCTPEDKTFGVIGKSFNNREFPIKFDDELCLFYIDREDGELIGKEGTK